MSKLTDAIRYYQTHSRGRVVPPLDLKYLECTQSFDERVAQDYIGYTFEARFRSSVMISEPAVSTVIDDVLAQVRLQIAEESIWGVQGCAAKHSSIGIRKQYSRHCTYC